VQRLPEGGLRLDEAARDYLRADEILAPDMLGETGPDLTFPYGGQTVASWLHDWLGTSIEVAFFSLRDSRGQCLEIALSGTGAVVETLGSCRRKANVSRAAHDFRNLLNILQTNGDLLQLLSEKSGDRLIVESVERMSRNIPRMSDLFEDIVAEAQGGDAPSADFGRTLNEALTRSGASTACVVEVSSLLETNRALGQALKQFVVEWACRLAPSEERYRLFFDAHPAGDTAVAITGSAIDAWIRDSSTDPDRCRSWLEAVREFNLVGGAWLGEGSVGHVLLGSDA
jgi:hypothetical protein